MEWIGNHALHMQPTDYPSAICFLYSVYMQRVVLVPRAGIFVELGSS